VTSDLTAHLTSAVVPVIVIVGIAIAGSAWAATGSLRASLSLLLDLLLAAGLLRLTVAASWEDLATAAAVVIVRKLAGGGVTTAARFRQAVHGPGPSASERDRNVLPPGFPDTYCREARGHRQGWLVGFRLRPSSSSTTPTTTAAAPRTRRRG
jgi:hypothetical protein